jgi:mRNA-degrading endonuclease RelE of RelBE toxin-antitoxin system
MRRLSSSDFKRNKQTLIDIAADSYSFKELKGKFHGPRSARFGGHRIIYTVLEAEKQVVLLAAEPRGSVYER